MKLISEYTGYNFFDSCPHPGIVVICMLGIMLIMSISLYFTKE